jgi:Tol biopolymer transport system component
VLGNGMVSAVGEGEATITATSEGRTATVALAVTGQPFNLVFDNAGSNLLRLDTRLGNVSTFWQHSGMKVSDLSVSPDRRFYAYTLDLGGSRSIAILDIATRTYLFVTNDATSDQPVWSPLGDRIAFRSSRAGRADIWTMRPDGTDAFRVTASMPAGFEAESPTWNHNGESLAFASGPVGGDKAIYTIRADGTAPIRHAFSLGGHSTDPSWRGDVIVYTKKNADGSSDIWRGSISGGTVNMRLTQSGLASAPAWSPDGRWIAYSERTSQGGPSRIMATRPFGDETRMLVKETASAMGAWKPAWARRP